MGGLSGAGAIGPANAHQGRATRGLAKHAANAQSKLAGLVDRARVTALNPHFGHPSRRRHDLKADVHSVWNGMQLCAPISVIRASYVYFSKLALVQASLRSG